VALRVADDEQVGQQHQAHRAEVAGVEVAFQRGRGVVVLAFDHLLHVHHGDSAAAAVLQELGVVDGAVVVDHEGRLAVLADDDVGGIAERTAVEAVQRRLRAAAPPCARDLPPAKV